MKDVAQEIDYAHRPTDISSNIVLVGNPNVGKSTIFNALSGLYVDVSNYSGTTQELFHAKYHDTEHHVSDMIDTPGVYGIGNYSDEEKVTKDIVLQSKTIINIIDANHIERDLFLTLQLIDMQFEMIVVLNMIDVAKKNGLTIAIDKLSENLGIPVIDVCGTNVHSLEKIKEYIPKARKGKSTFAFQEKAKEISEKWNEPNGIAKAVLILEGDENLKKEKNISFPSHQEKIYVDRRNQVNKIVESVCTETGKSELWAKIGEKIGKWSIHPIAGIPILLFSLFIVYQVIGVLVAQRLVGHTEVEYGNKRFEPFVKHLFAKKIPVIITVQELDDDENLIAKKEFEFTNGTDADTEKFAQFQSFIHDKNVLQEFEFSQNTFIGKIAVVLAGEFGAITMTVTYLLFLLLPLAVGFYFFLAILEDCGYLPRIATLVDRLLNILGLNGKAIIPIILGFGCVTMATITTRLLTTNREKTIAISILNYAIPCSAQLAVITALFVSIRGEYIILFCLIILTCLVFIGTILNKLLPGKSSPLLIDIPTMQIPKISNVLKKTSIKSISFMKEATPWFFVGAVIVSVMQVTGLLEMWITLLQPITVGWLHLPPEASRAFIMGIVRRDFGAAGLLNMTLTDEQVLISLTVITLFVPCIASVMAMIKEKGIRESMIIWGGSWVFAFSIGGIIANLLM